jgi:hypothetical protein
MGKTLESNQRRFVMMVLGIRSIIVKLLIVGSLALTLGGGSVAMSHPSHASAARYSCEQAIALGDMYMSFGNVWLSLGDPVRAANNFGKAEAYYSYC